IFFFSSRRRHTRSKRDWSSDVCSSDLDNIYDDKSGKRRVTGPVEYAIDGKDETAWGTEADPGRSNQPRKAVFTAEKPIAPSPRRSEERRVGKEWRWG